MSHKAIDKALAEAKASNKTRALIRVIYDMAELQVKVQGRDGDSATSVTVPALLDLADGPPSVRPDAIRGRGEDQVPLPPPQQVHTHRVVERGLRSTTTIVARLRRLRRWWLRWRLWRLWRLRVIVLHIMYGGKNPSI
eukprot:COSAG01_NODE_25229_length_751_cov_5.366564_1_plen_138_part_00